MKKGIFVLVCCLLAAIIGIGSYSYFSNVDNTPIKVNYFTVIYRNTSGKVGGAGTLKENAYAGYYCDIPVKVSKLYVKPGDIVKAGQPLFEIDMQATESAVKMLASGMITYSSTGSETVAEAAKLNALNLMTGIQLMQQLENLKQVTVAEYDCMINAVNCEENAFSSIFKPLVSVSDVSGFTAVMTLSESAANRVTVGMSAVVTSADSDKEYTAIVERVAKRANTAASALKEPEFEVILRLTDPHDSLKPNGSVTAVIDCRDEKTELFIPFDCLVYEESELYVYVLDDSTGAVEKRHIKPAKTYYNGVGITVGITNGERIVANPPSYLYDGCEVGTK